MGPPGPLCECCWKRPGPEGENAEPRAVDPRGTPRDRCVSAPPLGLDRPREPAINENRNAAALRELAPCPWRHPELSPSVVESPSFGLSSERPTRQAAARALPSTGMDNGMTERARSKTIQEEPPGTPHGYERWDVVRLELLQMNARFVAAMERALDQERRHSAEETTSGLKDRAA